MSSVRRAGGGRAYVGGLRGREAVLLKGQTLTKISEHLHQGEIEMTTKGERGNYSPFMVAQLGNGTKRERCE